jgi:ORF6N domain
MNEELVTQENIESRIFIIRGQKVMIDRDLAELYGVPTKYLNQQVHRNILRFPFTFMFQLSEQEKSELVAFCNRFESLKHSTSLPFAFTEHGVAMLASVLSSDRAIKMSIFIINTFVRLRQTLYTHKELAHKFEQLEGKVGDLDSEVKAIFDAIKQLMTTPPDKPKKIGFLRE